MEVSFHEMTSWDPAPGMSNSKLDERSTAPCSILLRHICWMSRFSGCMVCGMIKVWVRVWVLGSVYLFPATSSVASGKSSDFSTSQWPITIPTRGLTVMIPWVNVHRTIPDAWQAFHKCRPFLYELIDSLSKLTLSWDGTGYDIFIN